MDNLRQLTNTARNQTIDVLFRFSLQERLVDDLNANTSLKREINQTFATDKLIVKHSLHSDNITLSS